MSHRLQRLLLISGILSSLLYLAMNIITPFFWPGYNSVSQTVSELSAVGAPTRNMWIGPSVLYSFLLTAFGWGIHKAAHGNRALNTAAILLFIYGLISFLWPLAPMHQREVLAAGGETISDTMHLVLATVAVFFLVLAIAFGAAAFGRSFRIYSVITILLMLVFGALTAIDAPKVQANLPTPYAGLWERINIGAFLLWVCLLALMFLRKERKSLP